MPFYEYECSHCGFRDEVLQKINDKPLTKCPSCGKSALKKLMSAPVFRLKGSGWYETDFKGDKENKRNLAGADKEESKAEAKPETKAGAKPDAKPDAKADAKPEKAVEKPAEKGESSKATEKASRGASKTAANYSTKARSGGFESREGPAATCARRLRTSSSSPSVSARSHAPRHSTVRSARQRVRVARPGGRAGTSSTIAAWQAETSPPTSPSRCARARGRAGPARMARSRGRAGARRERPAGRTSAAAAGRGAPRRWRRRAPRRSRAGRSRPPG